MFSKISNINLGSQHDLTCGPSPKTKNKEEKNKNSKLVKRIFDFPLIVFYFVLKGERNVNEQKTDRDDIEMGRKV